MTEPLFTIDPVEVPPREKLSSDRRRTQRQAEHLTRGLHPLTAALGRPIKLHPEAAPADDRTAPGRRCGGCRFRSAVRWHNRPYAKCTVAGLTSYGTGRVTHGAGTDIRAWWPGCTDHEVD